MFACGAAAPPASAEPLLYQFSAVVNDVAPDLASAFAVGESLEGTVAIESTPIGTSTSSIASYAGTRLTASLGGDYAFTSAVAFASVHNNAHPASDLLKFEAPTGSALTGPLVTGHVPE